ncbi:MAG: hypothetical protein LBS43_11650 [Prevotellaceae bacterium]|jgi:hypothetical protein|nr:hypothetical protein [Prevotellaceae bacterium]
MMIAINKTGAILKSGVLALAWVSIITYTTFPQLFGDPVSFLSEQISFENTGKYLLFGAGIYVFDLWVHLIYFIDQQIERIERNMLIIGSFGCAVLCLLIVPLAIDTEMNRILPILMIVVSVGYQKGVNFYLNGIASRKEIV